MVGRAGLPLPVVRLKIFLAVLFSGIFLAAEPAKAALSYGNGYYTNLCDSGTAATYYNCDPGCDPAAGSCRSENQEVVKWVCGGKWNQCLESESRWSNFEQVDQVGCGYTVQLSKFDRKCRREDGSWDSGCRLLGYMVWYSGDCQPGSQQPASAVTAAPTSLPSATPSPSPTRVPSPTGESVTQSPGEKVCGIKCAQATDCSVGFACMEGECRNPACPADKTCFCQGNQAATASAVTKKSPDTGPEVWLGMAGMLLLGWTGWRLKKYSRRLW